MIEPVHPGFTIMPHLDKSFKDGVTYGTIAERSRIIKLLENAIDHDWKGSEPCEACDQTDYLIALIKGEK